MSTKGTSDAKDAENGASKGPSDAKRAESPHGTNALPEHVLEEIRELPARYPQHRSAVMPALDLAQEEVGYLTPEAMSEVAAALDLDPGYVEGVATFYTLFHLQPIGRHRFYVCTNLSCSLRGSSEIVEHVKKAIGVREAGEVSKDGLFSYEEVECLGACEYAPMMRLDHEYYYDLTPETITALVVERRAPLSAAAKASRRRTPVAAPDKAPPKKRVPRTKKIG
ncbi:MAG: NAD(P)H-dependent oxidoreductase subunit E [Chloroflexi bacterium]|nr:MAG: NAD(P)H-dependent oxidoreductase subunit E [Chloroflexota bacterium]